MLIIATMAINKQTNFLKNKSLGFSDKNIISLDVRYLSQSKAVVLRDMLKNQAGVVNSSLTNRDFFDGYSTRSFEVSSSEVMDTYIFKADNYFIPTLNLKLLEGRNFFADNVNPTDKSIIVNEEFVKKMKLDGSPIGSIISGGNDKFEIIGVVNNLSVFNSKRKN